MLHNRLLVFAQLTVDRLATLAEPVFGGPSSQVLAGLSKKLGMTIGAGLVEASDGRFYNSYVVAMPDGRMVHHRKLHAFVNPHLACGSEFTVFDTPHGCRVGVLICYDNNLIENARITALRGAEILLAPHQTGGCLSASPHAMGLVDRKLWHERRENPLAIEQEFRGPKGREWLLRWLPSRAHDNGMFLVFSNGVGTDDDEIRTGNAMILDPYGRLLAETWAAEDKLVVADLDAGLRERATGTRWLKAAVPNYTASLPSHLVASATRAAYGSRESTSHESEPAVRLCRSNGGILSYVRADNETATCAEPIARITSGIR